MLPTEQYKSVRNSVISCDTRDYTRGVVEDSSFQGCWSLLDT